MIKQLYQAFIFFMLCPMALFSQSHVDSVNYFKSYLTNTRDIVVEPFHWDVNDFANLTLAAGGTAFLMIYDEKINDFITENQNEDVLKICSNVIAPFGNGVYSIPLLGAVYLSGVIGKNNYDKEMALLGMKTFIIAAGEATVIKFAFQRHRPTDDTPPDAFEYEGPFGGMGDDGSFVSRHATTAFALATVFADGYKSRNKWVPWVAYSLASMVTLSRVYERDHWASDAFAGACLGFVTGKFLYKINSNLAGKKVTPKTFY
jgi:membrane-associated phospholipid phosphatase